jgi:S1-C subfamily serine protease
VVSVLPRSLRQSDRAFLGIEMDMNFEGAGVRIVKVEKGTAAEKAGLQRFDIITDLRGQPVNGSFELSTALQRLVPGEKASLKFRRGKEVKTTEVELGGRSDPRRIPYSRMEHMNNMGGHTYSEVRDGFRNVIQSDMQLEPEDCGAPVVDLDGRVVGIAVARAGRIKTFIIPSAVARELLQSEPALPRAEELAGRAQREEDVEDPFEVMRRKMEEMRRIMEELER